MTSTAPESRPISISANERLTYSMEETATLLGISRASAYEAARNGEIQTIRIGRRVLVPKAALHAWLESKSAR